MDMIPPAATARSNAYFEGGYWLVLWDFLFSSAIYLLLLQTRWSARMRDLAVRTSRFKPLQTLLYFAQFIVVTYVSWASRSSTTKASPASTNMAWLRKPSVHGWATRARLFW